MVRNHLVYVLPGIGGSVLERPGTGGKPAKTVWDAGFGDIAGLVRHPERLSPDEELRPTGLIRSKRLLPGWTVVPGYERLWKGLRALPGAELDMGHPDTRNPRANVVLFPYDFRLGVAHAARRLAADVHERLKDLSPGERAGRVVVIAHSMGGLVARYWLGPLQGWPLCRAVVTLGTPHRGAPKALDLLANGVRLAGVRLKGASELLREWPSVAELLPRYPMIRDATTDRALYPGDLPLSGLAGPAKAGFALHQEIEEGWRDIPRTGREPQVVPRLGWSHDTPGSARWDGRRLVMSKAMPTWLDLEGWEEDHGDGTVPALSAVPVELSGHDTLGNDWRTRDRHGPIASAGWVPGLAQHYEKRKPLTAARGQERQTALGLDLDELHAQGEPVLLRARLRGGRLPSAAVDAPASLALWASLAPADDPRTPPTEARLEWDERTGSYVTELPSPPPGLYDIEVAAQAVPGAGDLAATDTVAVVAP
jgi:hypothetical protein